MLYALSWFLVVGLLALWSLAAWAMHAVVARAVSHGGTLTRTASDTASGMASAAEGLLLPEWLVPWVPADVAQALSSLLAGLAPAVKNLLQAGTALASGLLVATWIIWGLGSALLILTWRRPGGGSAIRPNRQVAG